MSDGSHRPRTVKRKNKHDGYIAGDLFSGFGGLSQGIERGGFALHYAANHKEYKVQIHEANHPGAEHFIADLVDKDSKKYHDVRQLPRVDFLGAGISCVNHSKANALRAYATPDSLFAMEDPDYEARVTRSERDRATATCVLNYAAEHHPVLMLIECTTEFSSWGNLVPGSKKVGDGTTYRWWLKQLDLLGYDHKVLYLNSMFFGVGQSRDRGYWVFWKKHLPAPDLEHRPEAMCGKCDKLVEAVWTWKTRIPATGTVRYGQQYNYRCPSCRREVIPKFTPSLDVLDLSDLGTRIGDKPLKKIKDKKTGEVYYSPLARSTMQRAERCRQRFAEFPAVLMPAKAQRGSEKHPWQPMSTQTSQQETAVLSTGALMQAAGNTFERPGSTCRSRGLDEPLWTQTATNATGIIAPPVAVAVDNFQGAPRGLNEALPTQGGSETMAVISSGVLPYRKHTIPTHHTEAMPTVTSEQIPGLLTAAGWFKQNGSTGTETAPHPVTDAFGTFTSRDTTGLLAAQWQAALADLKLEDCYFRMMYDHEIGRGCGFDVDHGDHKGTFKVWGDPRARVDGYGNAVSPPVGEWITLRMAASLHSLAA